MDLRAIALALSRRRLYGRRVRRRGSARRQLPLGLLGLLVSRLALAQGSEVTEPEVAKTSVQLTVEAEESAAACPDVAWFRERVRAHAGERGQAGDFAVALGRRGELWQAKISRLAQGGDARLERTLQDRSPSCGPLADAVAITLAILADDVAERASPEAPAPAPPPPRLAPSAPPPLPTRDPRPRVWVGAGGGAAFSWISPVAPVLGFGLAVETTHTRHGVRLMLTTEQKFELVPGRVVVQAWLGTAFSCAQLSGKRFGAALCATFDASMLRASAEGFDDGKPSSRAYEALGLEAQPSWYITDWYRLSAVLGGLAPFTRESFSVTGRGVAYVPPSLNWRVLLISEIGTF